MSWSLKKKSQALLAAEQGTIRKDWGGKISVALVYPNTYAVGMSNLGFQTIYRHLNAIPDVVCERVFAPDAEDAEEMRRSATPPFSLESRRPLTDFHLVGFSVTYEGDGINVPGRYDAAYGADGTLAAVAARDGAPEVVVKRRLRNVNAFETVAAVKTPHAEYGHMALLEVGKGCGRGCRFCLEGQVYRPVRHRSVAALSATIADLAAQGEKRIGLVGACVSDYPWIGELLKIVEDNGMELSISSLRADSLTDDLVASLARGGHRTLTMAPEAGTERLRRAIRKAITDAQLMAACDLVRARGIPNLKCYFMIGQPTETSEDVAAIPDPAGRIPRRLRVLHPTGKPFGKLTLSISSFVPKPCTPLQWAAFDGAESLSAKLEPIQLGVRTFSNVRVLHENPREAALQALLARGDRRVGDFLELAARLEGDWRRALREWDGDAGFYTTRERPVGERMPWDHFQVGVKKAGLVREWERALAAEPALAGAARPAC